MSNLHATHTNKRNNNRTVPHHLASAVNVLDAHCSSIETMRRSVTVDNENHPFHFLGNVDHNKNAFELNHEKA